jgi:GNAT superfamily N-acetyltransferase
MSVDQGDTPGVAPQLALATAGDEAAVAAAIELGDRARATLGHMPFEGYRDAATSGTLLLAYMGEQIVGYALYGLSRGRVRLTHLCVDPAWRRRGVACQLVKWISHQHRDYPGILANCREDYPLGSMWIKLGFTQIGQHRGRSKAGHMLVSWWLDHGQPNLFTRDQTDVLVRAGVDLNVLRDLADPNRNDAAEAQALIADQIVGRLELVRTAALDAEINQMGTTLRGRCIACAQSLTSMRAEAGLAAQAETQLLAAAQSVDAGFPRNDQDRFDLAHVTQAVAVGLNVFVTRDERLTRIFGPTAEQIYGLRILRPADVVVRIDELARAEAYRPAAMLGTNYRSQLIGTSGESDLESLINHTAGERIQGLRKTVRDLVLQGLERSGVYDPSGQLVAATASTIGDGVLTVPLLRVAATGLADTIARQVLFQLRQQARDAGATVIRITDQYPSAPVRLAAFEEGYRQHDGQLYVFVVDTCSTSDQVDHHAAIAARRVGVPAPAPLRPGLPTVAAAELERIWWPAKITDSNLPSYLIPIQQRFSTELLGAPASLLPRNDTLGLAREHVYYRSPAGPRPQAPSRVLWYISSRGPAVASPSGIIACSQLESIHVGTPEDLHSRFRHLGVWTEPQLRDVARDGQVQALRFTNTEVLQHITLRRLRTVAASIEQTFTAPQGPLRITPGLFAAIYQEGRSK